MTAIAVQGAQDALSDVDHAHAREDRALTVREQLSALVPGLGEHMVESLQEALEATKAVRITEPCPKCACNHYRSVRLPDALERIRAIELVVNQLEGRPATAGDVSQSPLVVRIVE